MRAALGPDAPMVQLDDAPADRQPEAAAFVVAAAIVEAHEALENALALLAGHSRALVFEAHAPQACGEG